MRAAAALLAIVMVTAAGPAAQAAPRVGATIDVGDLPSGIAVGAGSVWVTNADSDTVSQIDPATNAVAGEFFATEAPGDIAVDPEHLWVIGNTVDVLNRLEIAHLSDEHQGDGEHEHEGLPVGRDPAAVVLTPKDAWVTSFSEGTVWRVSRRTFTVRGSPIPVGDGPLGIDYGESGLWVANLLSDTVTLLKPQNGKAFGSPIRVGDGPVDVVAAYGRVWVVNRFAGTVTVVDARRRVVLGTIDVGNEPTAIAAGLGGIWVTSFADDTVTLIDPVTTAPVGPPIAVGDRPDSIAAGAGAVWVANIGGTVTRIDR